jgi:drug/metabolite transporter (DMT)-like permease
MLVLLPQWRRPQDGPFCALVALVVLGILVNADVLGSLSRVHPRYAAPVIWLVPLLGAVAVLRWLDARREPSRSILQPRRHPSRGHPQ